MKKRKSRKNPKRKTEGHSVATVFHPETKEPIQKLFITDKDGIIGFESVNGWQWLEYMQNVMKESLHMGKHALSTAMESLIENGMMERTVIEVKETRFKMTFIRTNPDAFTLKGEK